MQITKLATYHNRLSYQEALALAKSKGLRLLTLEESLSLDSDTQYADCRPYWVGTKMKYAKKATKAQVWNEGEKPTKVSLPLEDGWYLTDKHGIPNGAKSNKDNPEARYLWRYRNSSFDGPLIRRSGVWGFDFRRFVVAGCGDAAVRCGVLATSDAAKASAKPRTSVKRDASFEKVWAILEERVSKDPNTYRFYGTKDWVKMAHEIMSNEKD